LSDSQRSDEGTCFRILVAEDEPSSQLLLERILQHAGHQVTVASNGQEALKYLNNNVYDIGVFDMQMPVMNGTETIEKFTKNKRSYQLPFIILTASNKGDVMKECQSIGVDVILTKPISSKNLLAAINRVCSNVYEYNN